MNSGLCHNEAIATKYREALHGSLKFYEYVEFGLDWLPVKQIRKERLNFIDA